MQTLIVSWTITTSQTKVGDFKTMTLHLSRHLPPPPDICPSPPRHLPPRHLLPRRLPPDICPPKHLLPRRLPPDICPPKHLALPPENLPPIPQKLINNC